MALSSAPAFPQLCGAWTRSLLIDGDGRRDETTDVIWLQGPRLYVDLRQPAGAPDLRHIARLRDLDGPALAWMAAQEGFAGRLCTVDDAYEWRRDVDLQPPAALPDAGRLRFDSGTLVEHGRDRPYVEHWKPLPGTGPSVALSLRDREDGRPGVLVLVGGRFGYARGRAEQLPGGATLAELVLGADSDTRRRALFDCEVSMGSVDPAGPDGWVIGRSSLPYRRGRPLRPELRGDLLTTFDALPDGRPAVRGWDVLDAEGDLHVFPQAGSPAVPSAHLDAWEVRR